MVCVIEDLDEAKEVSISGSADSIRDLISAGEQNIPKTLEEPSDPLNRGPDLKIDDYGASAFIESIGGHPHKKNIGSGKKERKTLKKFKSENFGNIFNFNSSSDVKSDLSDKHRVGADDKDIEEEIDPEFATYFKNPDSKGRFNETIKDAATGNYTDPKKVLQDMMREPGLNEKIFRMFSSFKKVDDKEDDESQGRTP